MCEKHQSIKPKYKNKNTANSSQTEFMRKCQKYAVNEADGIREREGQGACMGLESTFDIEQWAKGKGGSRSGSPGHVLWEAVCSQGGRPKHWLGAAMTGQHGDVRRAIASG